MANTSYDVPYALKMRVAEKVHECINIINKRLANNGRVLRVPYPEIYWDCRGTRGGFAQPARGTLHFNPILFKENLEHYLISTVPHEVAHVIDYALNPNKDMGRNRRSIHGPSWKNIMRILGAEPNRCHTYDTTNAQVRIKNKYEYKCSKCSEVFVLGPTLHKRIQAGQGRKHTGCGGKINSGSYVAPLGQVSYAQALRK